MGIKFIHTSDWQIGKVFRFLDNANMGLLQEARLQAITGLAKLAVSHDAQHVLVAGDVYDMEALSPRSINQPIERMRAFPTIHWHLLPGNHDPHRPNGLWDLLLRRGLPDNIHAYILSEPAILEDGSAVLLPAPLQHRRAIGDPTEYMNNVNVSDGTIRVGLAHGTITSFGSADREVPNHIAPDRTDKAHLSYLALGDWHGQKKISDRCWYSGTPETDAFDVINGGKALLVQIDKPNALPVVTPMPTGHYTWISLSQHIKSREDVDFLADKLRSVAEDLNKVLVYLTVEGAVSLRDRGYFEERIVESVSAALRFLRVDDRRLFPSPTLEDLDQIDRDGFVRVAAEELKHQSEQGDEAARTIAAEALQRLYVEHMKLQAEQK